MRLLLISYFFLFALVSFGQTASASFSLIDKRVKTIQASSADSLAFLLTKPYKTPLEKVRSIFRWITENIAYDIEGYHNPKGPYDDLWKQSASVIDSLRQKDYNDRIVQRVLVERKAICEGYARLFNTLCTKANIQSVIIDGYARSFSDPIGVITNQGHAWNAVFLNNKWELLDVTWASGSCDTKTTMFTKEYNDFYFLASPFKMLNNHYPADPKWTLFENPPSKERFYSYPYVHKNFYTSGILSFYPLNGLLEVSIVQRIVRIGLETTNKENRLYIEEYPQTNNTSSDTLTQEEYDKKYVLKYKIDGKKLYWDYEIKSYKTNRIDIIYNDKTILSYGVKIYK